VVYPTFIRRTLARIEMRHFDRRPGDTGSCLRLSRFWLALGGFEATLPDLGGSYQARSAAMGLLSIGGAFGLFVGMISGSHLWSVLLCTVVWSFMGPYATVLDGTVSAFNALIIVIFLCWSRNACILLEPGCISCPLSRRRSSLGHGFGTAPVAHPSLWSGARQICLALLRIEQQYVAMAQRPRIPAAKVTDFDSAALRHRGGFWNSSSDLPTPPFHPKLSHGPRKRSVDRCEVLCGKLGTQLCIGTQSLLLRLGFVDFFGSYSHVG
jgi:hypothetical protein